MNLPGNDITRLAFPLILVGTVVAAQPKPLTNADVVALVEAAFGEALIVAKVEQAAEVAFDLAPEDLAALKKTGVSEAVIAAMLERATPREQAAAVPMAPPGWGAARVWLETDNGHMPLEISRGMLDSTGNMLSFGLGKRFMTYPGLVASVRITDRQPTLILEDDIHPRERYLLVRLMPREKSNDRALRLGSMKRGFGHFKMRSHEILKPPEKWLVSYTADAEVSGQWRLTPDRALPPDEYGLFVFRGQGLESHGLFAFGVD